MSKEADVELTPIEIDYPEAPASINWFVTDTDGYTYQVTLRDANEMVLMKRVGEMKAWLKEKKFTPRGKQPKGNGQNVSPNIPPDDPGYCRIHETAMTRHEKDGQHWYSHKVGDDWCKGK